MPSPGPDKKTRGGRAPSPDVVHDGPAWERRHGESDVAWAAFTTYRDMGTERSLQRCASHIGKSARHVATWSTNHDWHRRTTLYDSWIDRQALQARVDAIRKMEEIHAQVAGGYIAVLTQPLRALGKDRAIVGDDGGITHVPRSSELEKLDTPQLIGLAESAARTFAALTSVERLARGAERADNLAGAIGPQDGGSGVPQRAQLLSAEDKVIGFLSALRDAGMAVPLLDDLDSEIEDAEVVSVEPPD